MIAAMSPSSSAELVPPPVYYLDAHEAFDSLSENEKEYLFNCSQASWIGSLIDLIQTSPESAGIFLLASRVFSNELPDALSETAVASGFTQDEVCKILSYFAAVFSNLGNYQSFGDTKFIPAVPLERLKDFLCLSQIFQKGACKNLFDEISGAVYSLSDRRKHLGFGPTDGISTYYSGDCKRSDAELVQKYMESAKIEGWNTRLFKEKQDKATEKNVLTLRFASAERKCVDACSKFQSDNDCILRLCYGDYAELMGLLVESIQATVDSALNPNEANMWRMYAESFRTGSTEKHKEGSKIWIEDKDPIVESYIGFIENYRDPLGVRSEFEGFVAVVNKQMSAKFQKLVQEGSALVSQLPWPAAYSLDVFKKPDFTSLDVVTFATSGVPVGINIPNYDDIREKFGFKNVSLGNVLAARFQDPKTDFIAVDDKKLYLENAQLSFEIQVGLHELLGHGSGKLFTHAADGTFNFDKSKTLDIITGQPVQNWYEAGESWSSKFSNFSSAMEECRAECVGVYLCDLDAVLKIFHVPNERSNLDAVPDAVYINWLCMVQSGVKSMEFYTPSKAESEMGIWGQAHCCARYVILRVLLEADPSFLRIDTVTDVDGAPNLCIVMNRDKIPSVAKPAIGKFLTNLQYYKSTGNAKDGIPFFKKYAQLSPEHLKLRQIVLNRKRPRPLLVQPGLRRTDNGIQLVKYEATYSGLIQSFVDRFKDFHLGPKAIEALEVIWRAELPYFADIPV